MVLDLPAREDQAVTPGTPLVTVAASDGLEVKVDILTDDMADVRVGEVATDIAPALGGTVLTGRVAEIYPPSSRCLCLARRRRWVGSTSRGLRSTLSRSLP